MSDSGFPPFRSAPPRGQAKPASSVPTRPLTIEEAATLPLADREELEEVLNREDSRPVRVNPDGSLSEQAKHITVCAKCGSREVREAVLIGDEVYVKLEN